ncbi:MAG: peptide ABC transporter substrate-binding protein, partial [Planctomycetales bacterium]|nr:peptide ABC transporter substrate-binding protein [Planctomycetales bacterium]
DKEINGRRMKFEFSMMTYQSETGIQTATLMKQCLDKIGVICHVKPTEFTVMEQKDQDHEFDAAMGGWGTSTDPYTSKNLYATGENRNYGQYANPRVDELFEQGERERDQAKRAEIYGQIHQILWDDQPYTWLFYRAAFHAYNKKMRGYSFSPKGPYDFSPGFSSYYVPADAL